MNFFLDTSTINNYRITTNELHTHHCAHIYAGFGRPVSVHCFYLTICLKRPKRGIGPVTTLAERVLTSLMGGPSTRGLGKNH